MKLEDILAEHKKSEIGASYDTDYKVIEQCITDCPACAQKKLVEWFTKTMHKADFTDVWYAHPGLEHYDWPDRWHVGVWTGPQGDLICVKHCKTNEAAERWLSPGANNPFEALEKAIALRREVGVEEEAVATRGTFFDPEFLTTTEREAKEKGKPR